MAKDRNKKKNKKSKEKQNVEIGQAQGTDSPVETKGGASGASPEEPRPKLSRKEFEKEMEKLQVELVKLQKDIDKLKTLFPDVENAYTTLAAAKLPGILRDKQAKWDEKLQVLTQSVKEYKASVEKNDAEGILKAAEAVHMNYEQMVRLVRPVVKELDVFHQSLCLLHHYYVPENKTEQIKAAADSLVQKIVALNGAALPKRLEAKTEQFKKALKNLDESVKAFAEAVKAKKGKDEIAKLENTLHARYQVVEKVFE